MAWPLAVLVVALGGCGSIGAVHDNAAADQQPSSPDEATADALPLDDGGLAKSYQIKTFRLAERPAGIDCSGVTNAAATLSHVYLAQHHLLEPGWPFFFLVGNRPVQAVLEVVGSGPLPEVRIDATLAGQPLGRVCLQGPAALPTTATAALLPPAKGFVATLPAAWIKTGLQLEVRVGGRLVRTVKPDQTQVGPETELNLIKLNVDILNYNDGASDRLMPDNFRADMLSATPFSVVRTGTFPVRLQISPAVVAAANGADDGSVRPTVLTQRLCSQAPAPCQKDPDGVNGGAVDGMTKRMTTVLQRSLGEFVFTVYQATPGDLQFQGGWGGGRSFTSADFDDVTIHEFGHSLSLPHWGDNYKPANLEQAGYSYPYGDDAERGVGRGDSWNYDQAADQYYSPICQDANQAAYKKERSDAMQRNRACIQMSSQKTGPWDGFSDFSVFAMYRYQVGAAVAAQGVVPYSRKSDPANYYARRQSGFATLRRQDNGQPVLTREGPVTQSLPEERQAHLVPKYWETPLHLVYGVFSTQYPEANLVYPVLDFRGNAPALVDPTDPTTFAALKQAGKGPYEDAFYAGKDLFVKLTYTDTTTQIAIPIADGGSRAPYIYGRKGFWRDDYGYWAVAVPSDKPIARVELYERPFCVRPGETQVPGNIADPATRISAQNFTDGATLKASRVLVP